MLCYFAGDLPTSLEQHFSKDVSSPILLLFLLVSVSITFALEQYLLCSTSLS
jgi:hypothetical protein